MRASGAKTIDTTLTNYDGPGPCFSPEAALVRLFFAGAPEIGEPERKTRRDQAADDFAVARQLAMKYGHSLVRRTNIHYQLSKTDKGWLVNLYPGNQRIYADKKRPRAPFIRVVHPWTLLTLVESLLLDQMGELDNVEKQRRREAYSAQQKRARLRSPGRKKSATAKRRN